MSSDGLARAFVTLCTGCGGQLAAGVCEPCGLEHVIIAPNPGPQSAFLATKAKVVVYGGAAGGGKTWAMLIDALHRALATPGWAGLICRSLLARMTDGGGAIWAEAHRVFEGTGAVFNESLHTVTWPANGSTLTFRQIIGNRAMWNGPSFDWIGIEELQEVEIDDLVSAMTRLRSAKGCSPRIVATCNPKRGHGLVPWIEWYLTSDGSPDRAKSGTVRWFCRSSDTNEFVFADTPAAAEDAAEREPGSAVSFTFIDALLPDNPALVDADPSYRANIQLQGRVKEAQLLGGNWYAGGDDDGPLARDRWEHVSAPLAPIVKWMRSWDKAATRPHPGNMDPDYTVGPLVAIDANGRFYFAGLAACREETPLRDRMIADVALLDGAGVEQLHKKAPGDTGKSDVVHTRKLLAVAGADTHVTPERKNKNVRIQPMALALELGMWEGRPVQPGHMLPPGAEAEPRFFVLDGHAQPGWPPSYRQGWTRERYRDAGSHPRTLGELAWSHLDPWPNGDNDDIPDALADAFDRAEKRSKVSRSRSAGTRARGYVR
jgi:hypothetical protein